MTVRGEDRWPDRKKFRRPQKKDFPLAVATKTTAYSWSSESGVRLDLEARTLTWWVSENNHAVERAHDHPMSRWLFQALSQVDWGRSGGGAIVGNDEYNRDDRETGGGGNYITRVFGPAGRKEQEWATGVKAARILGAIRRSRS